MMLAAVHVQTVETFMAFKRTATMNDEHNFPALLKIMATGRAKMLNNCQRDTFIEAMIARKVHSYRECSKKKVRGGDVLFSHPEHIFFLLHLDTLACIFASSSGFQFLDRTHSTFISCIIFQLHPLHMKAEKKVAHWTVNVPKCALWQVGLTDIAKLRMSIREPSLGRGLKFFAKCQSIRMRFITRSLYSMTTRLSRA